MHPFSLITPPGWKQFDLSEPFDPPVRAMVREIVADLPEKIRVQAQEQLTRTLTAALTALEEGGAVTALIQAQPPSVNPSFPVISVQPPAFTIDGEEMDPMDFLIGSLSTGEFELIEPPHMVGVRRVSEEDTSARVSSHVSRLSETESAPDGLKHTTRHVEYILGVPDTADQWMHVFSSFGAPNTPEGQELLEAITEFLDVWVDTISWEAELTHND